MLLSPGALPWWAWLLSAAVLALLSAFAVAFAVLPAANRPGGWGCLILTGLVVVATLLTAGIGIVQAVRWVSSG